MCISFDSPNLTSKQTLESSSPACSWMLIMLPVAQSVLIKQAVNSSHVASPWNMSEIKLNIFFFCWLKNVSLNLVGNCKLFISICCVLLRKHHHSSAPWRVEWRVTPLFSSHAVSAPHRDSKAIRDRSGSLGAKAKENNKFILLLFSLFVFNHRNDSANHEEEG